MKIFSQSVEGSSHKGTGLQCQDFSCSEHFENFYIVVLSDGHGSKTYVRSHVGSRLACEIALNRTKEFVDENYSVLEKIEKIFTYSPDDNQKQYELFSKLFRTIYSDWEKAIKQDSIENPFTSKEKSLLGNSDLKHAYGCTLMLCVKSEHFTFIFHIGDGRIFSISHLGEWTQPVPWDKDCKDNITTSLCEPDPINRFRYYFNGTINQPFIVFLCSDGIEDCYGGEHDENFQSNELIVDYEEVLRCFLQDDDFQESCIYFLDEKSKKFSHDDMSIAFIVDDRYNIEDKWLELISIKNNLFKERNKIISMDSAIKDVDDRIKSITENIERCDKEIGNLTERQNSLDTEIQNLSDQIEEKQDCDKSGESFRNYFNEFPKNLSDYTNSCKCKKKTKDFLKKMCDFVIEQITKIIEKIDTDLNSNRQLLESLSTKKQAFEEELKKVKNLLQTYGSNREKQLQTLTELRETKGTFNTEKAKIEESQGPIITNLNQRYDVLLEHIRKLIPSDLSNILPLDKADHSQNINNEVSKCLLTICKFELKSKEEYVIIEFISGKYIATFNDSIVQINREFSEKLANEIKSIDKKDIIANRNDNCIVITSPLNNEEKCIPLDSEIAKRIWDLSISIFKEYTEDA